MPNKKKKPQPPKQAKAIGDFEQVASLAIDMATNKAKLKAVRTDKVIKTRNQN